MLLPYRWIVLISMVGLSTGCATKQDFEHLESKVDQLIQATHRSALEEIFGEQASQITLLVNDLDANQRQNFENLQKEYASGNVTVAKAQQQMLNILGNSDRLVSTKRGIYVRNLEGTKLKAISNGTKIDSCRLLQQENIPLGITERKVLNQYSWGQGALDGQPILFPWELTISSFTKEIAEHTARRTAEEFIKMGGDEQRNRPIRIQISTDNSNQIKVSTDGVENEIYFDYENANANAVKENSETDTLDSEKTYEVGPWSVGEVNSE